MAWNGTHAFCQPECGKTKVRTAEFVILSLGTHGKCEICLNGAFECFYLLDFNQTWMVDARIPPDSEVMHRLVQGDAGMMRLMHLAMHGMVGHRKDLGKPLTVRVSELTRCE